VRKINPYSCKKNKILYSNIENLVLWARSEKIGSAVNKSRGKMEYWNAGMVKTRVWWNEI